MGTPREPKPAKYFVSLLSSDRDLLLTVENQLTNLLGAVESRSEILPWDFSTYYEREMGRGLLRRFVSFFPLASPGKLANIKIGTQQTEDQFRVSSNERTGRSINIDPGYLDSDKVVLASTKNAGHRIYLDYGIYAEATLVYSRGEFRSYPHTYPDYRWPQALSFFASVRASYLAQLRQQTSGVLE